MATNSEVSNLDFKNKTSVITATKKHINNNFSILKKEIIVNIKKSDISFNDVNIRNAKIEVDSKNKTVLLKFPVTKTGTLTLDENLNVISLE
jgi:hypothetical protein